MVIPAWLYREKFKKDPPEEDAAVTIEHHIPEKREAINIEPLNELKR